MRIIKHGDKFEIGETTCLTCHCVFAYTKEDVGLMCDRDAHYNGYFVSCPECSRNIFIPVKEVEI